MSENNADFQKLGGKKSLKVNIGESLVIDRGTEGEKVIANVSLTSDTKERHARKFFIKRAKEVVECPETKHRAIIEKYLWLKNHGHPVPPNISL